MILAVCAAEERLLIVLGDATRKPLVFDELCGGRMNEVLAPAAAALLAEAGLAPAALALVACVRGPGSFTGVRLSLAFCHGLALAASLPLAGLDYLPLLAASAAARFAPEAGELHVLTHSRKGKVYHQGFALPQPTPLAPPGDVSAEAAARTLVSRAAVVPVSILGSGVGRNPQHLTGLPGVAVLDPLACDPDPQTLLAAALAAERRGPPVDALYLRASDAEESLDAIAQKRGLEPAEARKRLDWALREREG